MAQPAANPLQALGDSIAQLEEGLRQDKNAYRHEIGAREQIKEQCGLIRKCDGFNADEVRYYLHDIDLAFTLVANIPNGVLEILTITIQGNLRNEVERFLTLQPDR